MSEDKKTCWILTDGKAMGSENQARGLAEALGMDYTLKRVNLKTPWLQLTPWLCFHEFALGAGSDPIAPPWPDLVIGSGRKTIGIARHIKKKSGGKTLLVQVQDPRINPKLFDLVVVPQHDPTRAPNVLVSKGSLHRITPEKLAAEKQKWEQKLQHLPSPRIAVLIGGSSQNCTMTTAVTQRLAEQLAGLKGGLMITASRRTGEKNIKILRDMLFSLSRKAGEEGDPRSGEGEGLSRTESHAGQTLTPALSRARERENNIFFWDGTGDNPYFGFLALADYIIVTKDSVSMASEAISTGKPVYIAPLDGGARRLDRFHRMLQEQGYTRPFTGVLEKWSYTPPDDTMRAAGAVRQLMKEA